MPKLRNMKHETMAQSLAAGRSIKDSYISAGYQYHASSASALAKRENVAARVSELRLVQQSAESMHAKSLEEIASIAAGIDRGYVIARAVELVERCMSREPVKGTDGGVWQFDSSGAARGLELIGKSLGMFSERLRLGIGPDLQSIPDAELESVIDRLKAVSGGVVLSLPSAVRDVVGHSSASYSGDIDIIPAALAEQDAIATLAAREQGATVGPERSLEVEPSLPAGQQGVSLLPELAPVKVRPVKAREVAAIGTAPTFSLRPPSASEILGLLKPSPVGDAGAEGALASEREGEGERPQL